MVICLTCCADPVSCMDRVPTILVVVASEVAPAAVPVARWQVRRHQRLTCSNSATSAGSAEPSGP